MGAARVALAVALSALLGLPSSGHAQRGLVLVPDGGGESRVALVIGNSAYQEAPLKNPANDAADMARALRGLGFAVDQKIDASRADMKTALREFSQRLREGGVGLFYYAGHGIQSRGRNFLIPVDASIQSEAELEYESVDANLVLSYMDQARTRISVVILDACRNNPFARSFRSVSRGLVQMEAGRGTFIAFATAPGSVAADGDGRNGLYTQHLLDSLRQPDTDIDKVFRRVTAGVARTTNGEQVPWVSSSLTGDFSFAPRPAVAAAAAPASAVSAGQAVELAFWDTIKDSRNPADFREYLVQFPSGRFAGLARIRLGAQQPQQVAMASPAAPRAPIGGGAPQPDLKVGDHWLLRIFDAMRKIETRTFEDRVESAGPGGDLNMSQTVVAAPIGDDKVGRRTTYVLDPATWSTKGVRMVEGESSFIAFPLHVGKRWRYSFKSRTRKGDLQTIERVAEVAALEDVQVPAGVFQAFKIVHTGTFQSELGTSVQPGTETHTFWYSPEAKRWVKREIVQHGSDGGLKQHTVIELVKAELQR